MHARIAVGLRSTTQSISIVGIQCGQFEIEGLSLELAQLETAGPVGVRGLQDGDWEFAEFGAIPVVQAAAQGHDVVIIASVEPRSALFLMACARIDSPSGLSGGRIGVLSSEGQTGFLARLITEKWGIADQVTLAPLQTYPNIYRALRSDTIEAGVLSADYRFDGEHEARLNALVDLAQVLEIQGPCIVTTRAFIRRHPDFVRAYVAGYVRSVHLFKTKPEIVLPILQRHLGFADPVIRQIYDFYAPRFQATPRPSHAGVIRAIEEVGRSVASADALRPEDICDLSFIDGIESSRFITRLYQGL